MGLDELVDIPLEKLVAHSKPTAGVEELFIEEKAVGAVQVADGARGLSQHVDAGRRFLIGHELKLHDGSMLNTAMTERCPLGSQHHADEGEGTDEKQCDGDGHGDRAQRIVGEIPLPKTFENSGVLDDRGEQGQHAEDDKAPADEQGAANRVQGLAELRCFQIVVELANAEAKANQGEGGANPSHQRSIGGLPIALSGELGGGVAGGWSIGHDQI